MAWYVLGSPRTNSLHHCTWSQFLPVICNWWVQIEGNSCLFSLPADVLWGSFVTHSFMRDKRSPKDVCGEATVCSVGLFCCAVFFLSEYIFWLPTVPTYTSSTLVRGFCCVLNYLLTHLQIGQQIKGFAFMFNLCLQQKPPGAILRRFDGH